MSDPAHPGDTPGGGRYDDVRGRLVSMGYLESSLDRFVLSHVGRSGSFLAQHAAVSLRVALTAGPILGILFAVAVVFVNRPRFSTPADGILLSVYFSVLFAAVVFVLELAAGFGLALIVRWRGRGIGAFPTTAARAGFVISMILTAYLVYWWRRRTGGSEGVLIDVAGLAALLLVNAALLRVSSLASLAALVRVSDLPPAGANAGTGSRTWMLGLLAAAILSFGFFLAPRGRVPDQAVFEVAPVTGRIMVIAWDGLPEGRLVDLLSRSSLAEQGSPLAAPHRTARLAEAGEGPELSRAAFWTEVATGRPESEHGVAGTSSSKVVGLSSPLGTDVPLGAVLTALLPGRRVAVSAGTRRAPTIWEILSRKEPAGAVGWWATWPAVPPLSSRPRLYLLTDRALMADPGRPWPPHAASPDAFAERLEQMRARDFAAIRGDANSPSDRDPAPGAAPAPDGRPGHAAVIDAYAGIAAGRLLDLEPRADLFVYLPGTDILRSRAHAGSGAGEDLDAHIERVLREVDDMTRRLGKNDWLVLVSDEGRAGRRTAGELDTPDGPSRHKDARGTVAVYGPQAVAGTDLRMWSPLDLAPTLLWLRGFPVSDLMPGRVRDDLADEAWRAAHPLRTISTFGDSPVPAIPPDPSSSEDEALERLRSLGYVN